MKTNYLYSSPKNTEERIEAIYEQTQLSEETKYQSNKTLRDALERILQLLQDEKNNHRRRDEEAKFSERASHIACAIFGFLLVFGAQGTAENYDWANESILFFSGLTLWIIFLSISLERQSFFRFLWRYGVVKFITSVIFAALAVHASAVSSSTINNVFGVDASTFVYTHSMLTGMLLFKIFIPVFWVVLISCLVHLLVVIAEWKDNSFSPEPVLYLLVSLFISGFVLSAISGAFNEHELEFKAYKLAHLYDFNDKIHCVDEREFQTDMVGVYLDNSHSQYLLDKKVILDEELKKFILQARDTSQITVPETYIFGRCG